MSKIKYSTTWMIGWGLVGGEQWGSKRGSGGLGEGIFLQQNNIDQISNGCN